MRTRLFAAVLCLASFAAAEPDYTTPTPIGESRPYVPGPIRRAELPNGMKLAVIESARLSVASLQIVFPYAGYNVETRANSGIAGFVAGLMTEGYRQGGKKVPGSELVRSMERLGARYGVSPSDDGFAVSIFVADVDPKKMKQKLDSALALVANFVRNPLLPEADLDRKKAQSLSAIEANRAKPGAVAGRRLVGQIYGDHPYANPATTESVSSIGPGDVRAFHDLRISPQDAVVGASGMVSLEEVQAMMRRHFGDWRATRAQRDASAVKPPMLPDPSALAQEQGRLPIELIDRPGRPQALIRGGHLAPASGHPDRVAIAAMEFILGGEENSRIPYNLRVQRGWTYGASAGISSKKLGGIFMVATNVRREAAGPAIGEMLKEIRRLQSEPASERELAWVKSSLPFSFVTNLQKAQNVAGRVAGIVLEGLPEDSLATYKSRVLALTLKDIQDAARNFLFPDRMHWVIEGDAAKICPQLKELRLREPQLGQVIVLDENEKPKAGCDDAT